MSSLIPTAVPTFVLLVIAGALTQPASAQLISLRHHSTAWGDHMSGASELIRARGAFLRDEADAAATWVQVAATADDLHYQRTEHWYQIKRMRVSYLQQKAEVNRERQQLETASEQNASLRLLQTAQRGVPQWPAALKNEKFAGSMTTIESILRNWSPEDATGDAYRRALATEAGVLRARIAGDSTIDHASRVAAVKTLRQLQVLATLPTLAAIEGQQLAAR
jgi:hypothetical protein